MPRPSLQPCVGAAAVPALTPGSVVVFGGARKGGAPTSDVLLVDTRTGGQQLVHTRGTPPSARTGHAAVRVGRWMLAVGGLARDGRRLTYATDVAALDLGACACRPSTTTRTRHACSCTHPAAAAAAACARAQRR
jgi:hypothetical protein